MQARRISIFLILSLLHTVLIAQFGKTSTTKAVIVGISDYQDESITDLEFAHRDAQVFASYLQKVRPRSIKTEHISLLINEAASGGQVHNALNNLLENGSANDQIIIYFSGHGDVETISDVETGHLLLHDTPGNNYQINSLRITDLRNIIQQLTIDIGADVLLIVDACRSGQLAGEIVNGAQATASALAQQFGKETKILSCQPNEKSLEGEQWGGGRGLFSYHLIEGLTGLADNNNDLQITVREIQRYLEDWVETDAAPQEQSPLVIGNKNKIVADVDKEKLLQLIDHKSNDASASTEVMASIVEKGIEIGISEVSSLIDSFYYALDQAYFIPEDQPNKIGREKGQSASELYNKILSSGIPEAQVKGAKGDFVAALQDGAQQAINAYLKSDNDEFLEREINEGQRYSLYPAYLKKAVDLVGSRHYLYNQLLSKHYYFQSVCLRIANRYGMEDPAIYNEAIQNINQALLYEDRAAYLYNELGVLYSFLNDTTAIEMYEKATQLSPNWAVAYCNLAYQFYKKKDYNVAEKMAQKGIELDGRYTRGLDVLSKVYIRKKRFDDAEELLHQYIANNGPNYFIYSRLGDLYERLNNIDTAGMYFELSARTKNNYYAHMSLAYMGLLESDLGIQKYHYNQALALRPYSKDALNNLGWLYLDGYADLDSAKYFYEKALVIDPMMLYPNVNLAKIHFNQNKLEQSEALFTKIIEDIKNDHSEAYYYLSQIAAVKSNHHSALDKLQLAIQYGYSDKASILENSNFNSLKEYDRFNTIVSGIK